MFTVFEVVDETLETVHGTYLHEGRAIEVALEMATGTLRESGYCHRIVLRELNIDDTLPADADEWEDE